VTRDKIPLASETSRGFMFGNKEAELDAARAGHGNEEA
jgi:hypothetical protein